MKKKILALVLTAVMAIAFVVPAMAAPGDINRVAGSKDFSKELGAQPPYVIFKQANDYIAIWTPDGVHEDTSFYYEAACSTTPANAANSEWDAFNKGTVEFFSGDEIASYYNKGGNVSASFWVSETDGIWSAHSTNVSIVVYEEGEAADFSGLTVTAGADLTVTTETKYEIWQKEFTPYREDIQYVSQSYSSVTATNADYIDNLSFDKKNNAVGVNVVPNSNHFTYAKLAVAELEDGIPLALVVGNKIDRVGSANIQLVDGKLEITLENDLYAASFGAMAFSKLPNPNNGNIHSAKDKDLQGWGGTAAKYEQKFKTSTVVIDMPANSNGYIYLYIHGDFQFDLGIVEGVREWTEEKEYQIGERIESSTADPVGLDVLIAVYECGDDECDCADCEEIDALDWAGLKPGTYKIVYTVIDLDDTVLDEEVTLVTVELNQITEATFSNSYSRTVGPVDGGIENADDITNPLVVINKTVTVK